MRKGMKLVLRVALALCIQLLPVAAALASTPEQGAVSEEAVVASADSDSAAPSTPDSATPDSATPDSATSDVDAEQAVKPDKEVGILTSGLPTGAPGSPGFGTGQLNGVISLQAFHSDLFTGSMGGSVPIEVAPGRNTPSIALSYSSQSSNGLCGVGWGLNLSYITRDTRFGSPSYDDTEDTFMAVAGGSGTRLAYDSTNGNERTYYAEVEQAFTKYVYNTSTKVWVAYDASGTAYVFGAEHIDGDGQSGDTDNECRLKNTDSSIFSWYLCKAQDTNDNITLFLYEYGGEPSTWDFFYPPSLTTLHYNLHSSSAGVVDDVSLSTAGDTHRVTFTYAWRISGSTWGDRTWSFISGFNVYQVKRLADIVSEVKIAGTWQQAHKYELDYSTSASTKRSLLTGITKYGSDSTALPTVNFDYTEMEWEFEDLEDWGPVGSESTVNKYLWRALAYGFANTRADLVDINRDGLPDRVMRANDGSPYNYWKIQLNVGDGFEEDAQGNAVFSTWTNVESPFGATPDTMTNADWCSIRRSASGDSATRTRQELVDINGDGLPDRVMFDSVSPYDVHHVQINNGYAGSAGSDSFESMVEWDNIDSENSPNIWWQSVGLSSGGSGCVVLRDIDGDGLADRVMRKFSSQYDRFKVQLNSGNATDGFGDIVDWTGVSGPNGSTTLSGWCSVTRTSGSNVTVEFLDMNGDSLPDRVMRWRQTPYYYWEIDYNQGGNNKSFGGYPEGYYSNHDVYGTGTAWNSVRYPSYGQYVDIMDMNGDGLPDRVLRRKTTNGTAGYDNHNVQINTGIEFEGGYSPTLQAYDNVQKWDGGTAYQQVLTKGESVIKVRLADINGDGLVDRVLRESVDSGADAYNPWKVQLAKGPMGDLLKEVTNGLGGKTTVEYQVRDGVKCRGEGDLEKVGFLPQPIYTVKNITVDDGMGLTATTSLEHEGGYFSFEDREFRGFYKCTGYSPETTNANGKDQRTKTVTYFHQGAEDTVQNRDGSKYGEYEDEDAKAGTAFRTEVYAQTDLNSDDDYDDTGETKLHSQTVSKVDSASVHGTVSTFPKVVSAIQFDCEGESSTSNHKAVASETLHDSDGRVIRATQWGEISSITIGDFDGDSTDGWDFTISSHNADGTDDTFAHTTYAKILGTYVLDQPSEVKVTNLALPVSGTLLSKAAFTYEANTANRLTGKVFYDTGASDYAETVYSYTSKGLAETTTGPSGVKTKYYYSSTTHEVFPDSEAIRSGSPESDYMKISYEYELRSGKVTKQTDERNPGDNNDNLVKETTYDSRYRATDTYIDDGTKVLQQHYQYNAGGISLGVTSNYVHIWVNDDSDQAYTGDIEARAYTDGLTRTIQQQMECEESAGASVRRVTSTVYNAAGKVAYKWAPYTQTNSDWSFLTQPTPESDTKPHTKHVYDAVGRAISTKPYPSGGDTGSPTDESTIAYKDGSTLWVTVATDARGKVTKTTTDAFGSPTRIVEDPTGVNVQTDFTHDRTGRVTRVRVDSNSNTDVTFQYDLMSRKTQMTDPSSGTWDYTYDAASRVTEQEDARGNTITYSYTGDPLGRLKEKKIYDSSDTLQRTITYSYDSGDANHTVYRGMLFEIAEENEVTDTVELRSRHSYNKREQITKTSLVVNQGGVDSTYTTETTYDAMSRMVRVTNPDTQSSKVKYHYDTNSGSLLKIELLKNNGTSWATPKCIYELTSFTTDGKLEEVEYGNGETDSYTYYTKSRRLQKIETYKKDGTNKWQELSYTYDKVSNVLSIDDDLNTGSADAGMSSLAYDGLHRVTSATYDSGEGTKTFSYDKLGNLTSNGDNGGSYTYGTASEPYQVTSANSVTYSYDACGNISSKVSGGVTYTYTYDEQNRLVEVTKSSDADWKVEFGYADGGARIWKKYTDDAAASTTTLYVGRHFEIRDEGGQNETELVHAFAGDKRIATYEPQSDWAMMWDQFEKKPVVVACFWPFVDGRALFTVWIFPIALGLLALLFFGLRRRLLDKYAVEEDRFRFVKWSLCMKVMAVVLVAAVINMGVFPQIAYAADGDETPIWRFYHTDHLGSTGVVTSWDPTDGDYTPHKVSYYTYTVFGELRHEESGSAEVPYRYTGYEFDDETELYFAGSRYYDPALGRFHQADSVVPDPSTSQAYNRYSYVKNNPLVYTDPSGHGWLKDKLKGWLGVLITIVALWLGGLAYAGIMSWTGSTVMASTVGGAVYGASKAAMTGDDIGKGAAFGAAFGFLQAGFYEPPGPKVDLEDIIQAGTQDAIDTGIQTGKWGRALVAFMLKVPYTPFRGWMFAKNPARAFVSSSAKQFVVGEDYLDLKSYLTSRIECAAKLVQFDRILGPIRNFATDIAWDVGDLGVVALFAKGPQGINWVWKVHEKLTLGHLAEKWGSKAAGAVGDLAAKGSEKLFHMCQTALLGGRDSARYAMVPAGALAPMAGIRATAGDNVAIWDRRERK